MISNNNKKCIGIDVSKATLDIYWQGRSYKIKNNIKAISAFINADMAVFRNR